MKRHFLLILLVFGSTKLLVPCGCVSVYENSDWHGQFTTIIEDCAAVSEVDEERIAVYPNPSQGRVTVETEGIQSIVIFNLLGEKVFESSVKGNVFEYDFSGREAGIYLIKIETAKGVETKLVTVE